MTNRFPTAEEARILANSKIKEQEEFLTIRNLILKAAENGETSIHFSNQVSNENKAILQKAGYKLIEHTIPSINYMTGAKDEVFYCTLIYW